MGDINIENQSSASCSDSDSMSSQDNMSNCVDSDAEFVQKERYFVKRLQSQFHNNMATKDNNNHHNMLVRKPTRRPNPKVCNRNALMARENRKKKKQHVESLEQDVQLLKAENHSLRRKLKKNVSIVNSLRDEKLYLKSIIANKTTIMTLLKTIQTNTIPITSSHMSFVTSDQTSSNISSPTSSYSDERSSADAGDNENDLDISVDSHDFAIGNWETLLNCDDQLLSAADSMGSTMINNDVTAIAKLCSSFIIKAYGGV